MKNLGQMLQQAQEMQKKMAEMQEQLESIEVEAAAGGGLVAVTLTAKGALKGVRIDPSLITDGDAETIEDLIVAAHNEAREKAQARCQEEMQKITGGLDLPEGFQMPF